MTRGQLDYDDRRKRKNVDLWEQLLDLCEKHVVEFIWITGHSGIKENEICDQLASEAALRKKLLVDKVYESISSHLS
jgi:ribonuclease HI